MTILFLEKDILCKQVQGDVRGIHFAETFEIVTKVQFPRVNELVTMWEHMRNFSCNYLLSTYCMPVLSSVL